MPTASIPTRAQLRALARRVAVPALVACAVAGELSAQPGTTDEDGPFFYSGNEKVRIHILRDSIAAVLRPGATTAQLQRVVRHHFLQVVRELPDGTPILARRPTSLHSAGWFELIRGELGAEVVKAAGLMVWAEGARTPMFLTNEVLVQFVPTASPAEVREVLRRHEVEVIPTPLLAENQFVVRVNGGSPYDAVPTANGLHREPLVRYAQPNFIVVVEPRAGRGLPRFIPNDALFARQWHLDNAGDGGTADADIDAPEAWALTMGSPGVVIAIIDDGFDMEHPDLVPNLWTNPGETAGNRRDDGDDNPFVDDVHGVNTLDDDGNPSAGGRDNHGTPVAGAAAARGDNGIGVSGSCPRCGLMLIRNGTGEVSDGIQAFNYARENGAAVINMSWGIDPASRPDGLLDAINRAATRAVVVVAMKTTGSGFEEDCAVGDPSALAGVIAVAASSNADARTPSGFGACMEVLGPTDDRGADAGSLFATSTDRGDDAGYNDTRPVAGCPSREPADDRGYTLCFGGTSFAAPVVAGVAGLVLSARPGLTPLQVRRLLNDAADKIQSSRGGYDSITGFSRTHGYGRVNAFEAVRVVAPAANGGRDGVDLFLRDNWLDWGNTEQPSSTLMEPIRGTIVHWASMDIKVDGPPYRAAPTAETFDAFADERPGAVPGGVDRVYVRARNRGPLASGPVTVRLFSARHDGAPPPLPSDFWTAFPRDPAAADPWAALACSTGSAGCEISTLAYSGATVAGTADDAARVVRFELPPAPADSPIPDQLTLLVVVDAAGDRPLPLTRAAEPHDLDVEWLTPNDNNVTQRRYANLRRQQ